MQKVILCDFYGVIFSNFNWEVIDDRIKSDQLKRRRFEEFKERANQGLIDNIEFKQRVAELADDTNHKEHAVLGNVSVNQKLIDFLRSLSDAKVAMLSNGSYQDVINQLKYCGCDDLFDQVFTSDKLDAYKPQAKAYQRVVESLGVRTSEVLFIDDSYRHIQGASNCGLQTHLYTDFDHAKETIERFASA